MILGIDEAGRGPVMGPLVLCGVWLKRGKQRALVQLGVQDSKAFGSGVAARARRAGLAQEIRDHATCVMLLVAEAEEVDRRVSRGELNLLEQELARTMIERGPPAERIVADGCRLFGPLRQAYPHLQAMDRAEDHCTAVAAASIVAKVERDRRFSEIAAPMERELGCAIRGGGYANRGTEALLRAYVKRFGQLPHEVRHTWSWIVLQELCAHGGSPALSPGQSKTITPAREDQLGKG